MACTRWLMRLQHSLVRVRDLRTGGSAIECPIRRTFVQRSGYSSAMAAATLDCQAQTTLAPSCV